jgi:hypothetical protein
MLACGSIGNLELGASGWHLPDTKRRSAGPTKLPPALLLGKFGRADDQQTQLHEKYLRDTRKQKAAIRSRAARVAAANAKRRELAIIRKLAKRKGAAAHRREVAHLAKLEVEYKVPRRKIKTCILQLESWGRMVPHRWNYRAEKKRRAGMREGDEAASKLQAVVRQAAIKTIFKPVLKARLKETRRRIDANRNNPQFQTDTLKKVVTMQCMVVPYLADANRSAKKTLSSFNPGNIGYYVQGKNELYKHQASDQKDWSFRDMIAWRNTVERTNGNKHLSDEDLNTGDEVPGNKLPRMITVMMNEAEEGMEQERKELLKISHHKKKVRKKPPSPSPKQPEKTVAWGS